MFKLNRPCVTCPFRLGVGETFRLPAERLEEIKSAVAFQCHKTVDYEADGEGRSGDHPQQCAGLMSLLSRENAPNQIMQVGERLDRFDPAKLDHAEVYPSWEAAMKAHGN